MAIKKHDKSLMLEPHVKSRRPNRVRLDSWVRCEACVMVKYLIIKYLFSTLDLCLFCKSSFLNVALIHTAKGLLILSLPTTRLLRELMIFRNVLTLTF